MLLWLSLLFKRQRSSPHNVESAGRLTCAFYNLQLFQNYFLWMAEKTGTLWETAEETKSCNHGFASYAAVVLSDCVLGVEKIDYKAKKVFLHSADAKIDWVEGVYPTKDGMLRIRREGQNFSTVLPDGWETVTP